MQHCPAVAGLAAPILPITDFPTPTQSFAELSTVRSQREICIMCLLGGPDIGCEERISPLSMGYSLAAVNNVGIRLNMM